MVAAAASGEETEEEIEEAASVAVVVASAEEVDSEAVVTILVEAAEEAAASVDSGMSMLTARQEFLLMIVAEVAEEVVSVIKAAVAASVTVADSATAAASTTVADLTTVVALVIVVASTIVEALATVVALVVTVVASVTAVVSITMHPATDLGALRQMEAQVGMKGHQVAASVEEDKVEDQVGLALPEADTEETSSAKAVLVGTTTEKPSVRAIRSPHRIPVVLRVRFNVYYVQRCKFQGLRRLFVGLCKSTVHPSPASHLRSYKKASIWYRHLFLHDGLFSNTCRVYTTHMTETGLLRLPNTIHR